MTRRKDTRRILRDARRGFTLVELLVVVAIIAVLAGLTTAAVMQWIGSSERGQTITLLTKMETYLQQHWSEARKKAQNTPIPAGAVQTTLYQMAGGSGAATDPPNVKKRAGVIWVKLQMKREFPQTFAEALAPGNVGTTVVVPLGPIDEYARKINGRTGQTNPATQSAALLLMALERNRIGMEFNAEEILGAGFIKDTDGDGLREIVDAFGNPVSFYRWGCNNPKLDQSYTAGRSPLGLDRDTEDPEHLLMNNKWNPNHPGVTQFQSLLHPITQNGQPRSFFTVPTVVSAGKDGQPGLDPRFMGVTNQVQAQDNIYSFEVR